MAEWAYVLEPPCDWCATWIGRHMHSIRGNGELGNVVVSLEDGSQRISSEWSDIEGSGQE